MLFPEPRIPTAGRGLVHIVAAGLMLGACSSSTTENGPATDNFIGVFAGDNGVVRGRVAFAIKDDSSSATGVYNLNGTDRTFTSVVVDNGQVVASDGAIVAFTGAITPENISGTFDGPALAGIFTALSASSATGATAYCGAHVGYSNLGQPAGGVFAFVSKGSEIRGVITTVNGRLRGFLTNPGGTLVIDTVAATTALNVAAGNFTGGYDAVLGDNALAGGDVCPGTPPNPTLDEITGVYGTNSGETSNEFGSLSINLSSNGVGSDGHFTDSTGTHGFDQIISGPGNRVFMFATGHSLLGTLSSGSLTGDSFDAASKSGLFAGVVRTTGDVVTSYCGTHTGTFAGGGQVRGSYAFLVIGASGLSGIYTSDNVNFDPGFVGGDAGGTDATMGGQAGVSVLPDVAGFGGFYDFSATGGPSGTLSGTLCP